MATIGLSKPFVALYSATGTTVTYSDGASIGKLVNLDMSLDGGDTNVLYADNGAAESASSFGGGTLKLKTDDLSAEAISKILGITKTTMNIESVSTTGAAWLKFGDGQSVPYVGFGGIIKKQVNNATKWVALIYPKIQFQNFNDAASTQGDKIEWQTPELEAQLMRDDTSSHDWRWMSTPLDTEAEAEAAIKSVLNITA